MKKMQLTLLGSVAGILTVGCSASILIDRFGIHILGPGRPACTVAMCCGSVDSDTRTGRNCAYLESERKCFDDILDCEPDEVEFIDTKGNGSCNSFSTIPEKEDEIIETALP